MNLETLLAKVDSGIVTSVDRLIELLKIRSISTDPDYANDCVKAAEWLTKELNDIGFVASLRKTLGHPMVVAHSDNSKPRILFYGHYDVQPVDPLELWDCNPFEPKITSNNDKKAIQARGASDDKGQLMTFVEACRYWKQSTGELPKGISILFEGEEESASPSLIPFLQENKEELNAELAVICDTGLFESKVPAIITQLRGLVAMEFEITAADKDLHSGIYGGLAQNPNQLISKIIADFKDKNGRIQVPEFYTGVEELSSELAVDWNKLNFNWVGFLRDVGLSQSIGEKGKMPLEQLWSQPTFEVNGIYGGYTGNGFKTVIPSKASAKISCRLVGDQDPERIMKNIKDFITKRLPDDCQITFIDHGKAKACRMTVDHPFFEITQRALTEEYNTDCVYSGCGVSIPIAGFFQEIMGMNSLLTGFAKDNDNIHSPNEKYDLDSFQKGIRSWVRALYYFENKN